MSYGQKKNWRPSEIVDLYSKGYSDIEVIREMEITRKEFDRMYATNAVFRDVIDRGRDYAEAWNLAQSRENLHNKDFNTALFTKRMENLYAWASKVEQKNANINADLSSDEIVAKLATMLPNVAHLLPKEKLEELKLLTKEVPNEDAG
jgi:hypothetical protein